MTAPLTAPCRAPSPAPAYSALLRAGRAALSGCARSGAAAPSRSTRNALGERLGLYRAARRSPARSGSTPSRSARRGPRAPLVDGAARSAGPALRLLLTHGTATGRAAGQALLREGDVQAWLPFDTPGGARRFLDHFAPSVGVLMETEIWPNLLAEARGARICRWCSPMPA